MVQEQFKNAEKDERGKTSSEAETKTMAVSFGHNLYGSYETGVNKETASRQTCGGDSVTEIPEKNGAGINHPSNVRPLPASPCN